MERAQGLHLLPTARARRVLSLLMRAKMKKKWIYLACLLAGVTAWNSAIAYGQTDVAASAYGAFSSATQSGTPLSGEDAQSSSNSAGALLESFFASRIAPAVS